MSRNTGLNKRETFSTPFGRVMTMVGVAVGLGNIFRFPYMVGKFGGAPFVLFYIVAVLLVGIPALMAEWALGRSTRLGTLGAFEKSGFPGGKVVGWFFFAVVACASGYYSNTIGWVLFHGITPLLKSMGVTLTPTAILPPESGFQGLSFILQLGMTCLVILATCLVLFRGLKGGIERISRWLIPLVFAVFLVLIFRSVTLPGSGAGLKWYLGGFKFSDLTGPVMAAALGQAIFSLSLGGTFMVIYGSYLKKSTSLPGTAMVTGLGDLLAGLLAGLAIFPAVFALGLKPEAGPSLIFSILPQTFSRIPLGSIFSLIFFFGVFGAAFLSNVAAFEVMVAGLTDKTGLNRKKAVKLIGVLVFLLALIPMINMKIFIPWDLFFGSGMQTLGALFSILALMWFQKKARVIKELFSAELRLRHQLLYWWMRLVLPLAILFVGLKWFIDSVVNR